MQLPAENEPAGLPEVLSLAEFVRGNRVELIARCSAKVALRDSPSMPAGASPGVPSFLRRLLDELESESASRQDPHAGDCADCALNVGGEVAAPATTATEHGASLMRHGYSIDQVVHEYGDVCQAVTELAVARQILFSTAEFRLLNRCLDDAIADAVTGFQALALQTRVEAQHNVQRRLQMLMHDQQRLIGIARHSFLAIKSGHVGISGATATLLAHALDELLLLSEARLPRVIDTLVGNP